MTNHLPFHEFKSNSHSQNGEDGVIAEILNQLKMDNHVEYWCVEFGAWDGLHLSNSFCLVEKGWNAIYIEGNSSRFQELLRTCQRFTKIVPIKAKISKFPDDINSLDNLLANTNLPKDFELLSIDIDSYDLDIWKTLKGYHPKIVVMEIDSSIPPGIEWTHGPLTRGNSFSSTLKVAETKGYVLVCHTGNLIFVRRDLINSLSFPRSYFLNPELLYDYSLFDYKFTYKKRIRNFLAKFLALVYN